MLAMLDCMLCHLFIAASLAHSAWAIAKTCWQYFATTEKAEEQEEKEEESEQCHLLASSSSDDNATPHIDEATLIYLSAGGVRYHTTLGCSALKGTIKSKTKSIEKCLICTKKER
jgi:aspartate/methionine/tyrosine aminotransferase